MSAKDETNFYNKLDGMIQSGDDRGRANSITISLLNFKKLNGKGAPLPMLKTVQELKSKKSVITIQDEQCFAKSCLVMYYKENASSTIYHNVHQDKRNRLTKEAIELMK